MLLGILWRFGFWIVGYVEWFDWDLFENYCWYELWWLLGVFDVVWENWMFLWWVWFVKVFVVFVICVFGFLILFVVMWVGNVVLVIYGSG